ncbi:hypothetical protein ElyMa_006098500 [Elysia marginata]|uniref:Uncharacterized protein n=1 Tax=Elysia marginata TaxID=1093978 RepID=A0AAV4GT44_9GAST|nr:hypothetical protein ElyMa_006098500 [Elysia marginata]
MSHGVKATTVRDYSSTLSSELAELLLPPSLHGMITGALMLEIDELVLSIELSPHECFGSTIPSHYKKKDRYPRRPLKDAISSHTKPYRASMVITYHQTETLWDEKDWVGLKRGVYYTYISRMYICAVFLFHLPTFLDDLEQTVQVSCCPPGSLGDL